MPLMDWEKMLADGTVDVIGVTAGPVINCGQWPLEGLELEVYIENTVGVGTTTLLIQASANDGVYHNVGIESYDAGFTGPNTRYMKLVAVPAGHRYLRYNFTAVQGGVNLGAVQIGPIGGAGERH